MKLLFSIILLAIPALSFADNTLPPTEADIDSLSARADDGQNDKKIRYEGNVTLGLTYYTESGALPHTVSGLNGHA